MREMGSYEEQEYCSGSMCQNPKYSLPDRQETVQKVRGEEERWELSGFKVQFGVKWIKALNVLAVQEQKASGSEKVLGEPAGETDLSGLLFSTQQEVRQAQMRGVEQRRVKGVFSPSSVW